MYLARKSNDAKTQLFFAAKCGGARELYEETGIDVRSQLERLEPIILRTTEDKDESQLQNEHKHRVFFRLDISDDDFPASGEARPMIAEKSETSGGVKHSVKVG